MLDDNEQQEVQTFLHNLEDPTTDPDAMATAAADAGVSSTVKRKGKPRGRPKKAKTEPTITLISTTEGVQEAGPQAEMGEEHTDGWTDGSPLQVTTEAPAVAPAVTVEASSAQGFVPVTETMAVPNAPPRTSKASKIRQLWAEGKTRTEIARELGISFQQAYAATRHFPKGEPISFEVSGTCSRCGKALTDPRNVQAGIGPVCAQHKAQEDEL